MVRQLIILLLFTTPCFAQGLGNMPTFAGMRPPQDALPNFGNTLLPLGQFNYNYGNNPNVYEMSRPQVRDYLTPDPRQIKGYSNPREKLQYNYPMRRNFNINQYNYNQPLN
jgi:hypothetical protein